MNEKFVHSAEHHSRVDSLLSHIILTRAPKSSGSVHDCYVGRADGSEGAEIFDRRSRELVHARRGRLVDVALSRTRVPSSVVQVNDSRTPRLS